METAEELDLTQLVQSKVLNIKEVKPSVVLRGNLYLFSQRLNYHKTFEYMSLILIIIFSRA